MKIGSGTIEGRISSPDTGKVKDYKLTLDDISTEEDSAGGVVRGRIASPDTGRVDDYNFTLDDISIEEGDLTNGVVKGRIASPNTGNVGTYKVNLKDLSIAGQTKSAAKLGVTFLDYDGTVVAEYPVKDFLALEELPANPTHEGLTAQGWNWDLAEAKEYVEKYKGLYIGQSYITDDGKTRLYCHFLRGTLNPYVGLCVNGEVEIDWGDGTDHSTLSGADIGTVVYSGHQYANEGDYVISIDAKSGSFAVQFPNNFVSCLVVSSDDSGNRTKKDYAYLNTVEKIELGSNVSILRNAFAMMRHLETITIPIGSHNFQYQGDGCYTFYECSRLKHITYPKGSGSTIVPSELELCVSLETVSIPIGFTVICSDAFHQCRSLKHVFIPEGVTSLQRAFYESGVESVVLPDSVLSCGNEIFRNCYSLKSIRMSNNIKALGNYAFYNCWDLKSINLPEGIQEIPSYAFNYCKNLKSANIPNGVLAIRNYAFSDCNSLENVKIPDSVQSIGDYVFENCYSLTSVGEPSGVRGFGRSVFSNCYSLKSFTISDLVTAIPEYMFSACDSLKSIRIPDGVLSIGPRAFVGCRSLERVSIPDSVTSIGSYAFNGCHALKAIKIPSSVTTIDSNAFSLCYSLENIEFPDTTITYASNVFTNCNSLKRLELHTDTIPSYFATYALALDQVILADGIRTISTNAFQDCGSFASITIPSSVTAIGSYAFNNCAYLSEVHLLGTTPPSCGSYAFHTYGVDLTIYVPESAVSAYKSSWTAYSGKIVGE